MESHQDGDEGYVLKLMGPSVVFTRFFRQTKQKNAR